jgi:hypothetical protein
MPTSNTPSISSLKQAIAIAEQIEKLQAQLAALVGGSAPTVTVAKAVGAPRGRRRKRTLSPEARAKIAAAQRARWAKSKGTAPVAAKVAVVKKKKSGLTTAGRAKLAAAMKARWAARKKGAPAPNAAKK